MSLYSDLIERGRAEKREGYVSVLVSEAGRVATIIANVNELAEMGNLRRERVMLDMHDLVSDSGTILNNKSNGRDLHLEVTVEGELPARYSSSGTHLPRAISHLVENAVSHTEDGGSVAINLWVDNQGDGSGDYLNISVGDSGCGMDLETMQNLFEPFTKGDKDSLNAGLGAMIAKYVVVDIMGGYIRVFSEPGQGTQVTLSVPI